LVALLGTGGMAEVYRGRDLQSGQEMAVKVLPAHLAKDPGYVTRFRTEAQRVAVLDHGNVVPVTRFGEDRGLLYLVMPVLKESLRDRMDREHILDQAVAARLAVQIAAALDAAHRQGLVHRDVKPENILLNEQGRALLTDFGIAREVDVLREPTGARTLAATGLPVGTPEYMAPEQLRGGAADQRVDVYALGAVLYEMLTGHVPHDADTPYEVAARVLTEKALPPTEYNPAIWPELEEVVLGALAPDPNDRYPDMRSFAGALRRAVMARTSGTAQMTDMPAAGMFGVAEPTPLARSLATRRLGDDREGQFSQTLLAMDGTFAADGRKPRGGRRGLRVALAAVAVVVVLAAAAGGAFAFMGKLGLGFFGLGGGSTSANATATAAAISTPTTIPTATLVPTATPRPTATSVPSLSISPTTVQPCFGSDDQFTITYTGGPSSASMTATSTSGRIGLYLNGGNPTGTVTTTLYSGGQTVIHVRALHSYSQVKIQVNISGFSQQIVTATQCGGG
jgi:serine/threonine-protein kinase